MNPASYNPLKDTHFWFRVGDEGVDAVPHRCVSSPRYMQAMAVLEEGGTEAEATEAAIDAAEKVEDREKEQHVAETRWEVELDAEASMVRFLSPG